MKIWILYLETHQILKYNKYIRGFYYGFTDDCYGYLVQHNNSFHNILYHIILSPRNV